MPELPEVETMVRGVRSAVIGRRIQRMEFCKCSRRPLQVTPPAPIFNTRIQRQYIVDVRRLAKRIILDVAPAPVLAAGSAPDCHIVIEPRMTGLLLISEPPTTEHRRICWHLQARQGFPPSLDFWDRRGLGTIRLLEPSGLSDLFDRLGPDALQMTLELWRERLSGTTRPVKVALLDQQLVAGIGNLYASEILHAAGINPHKPAQELTPLQCRKLHQETQRILAEAIRYEGSTLNDGTYRNALNKDGSYQNCHRVYNREAQPCTRCRTGTIQRIVQAQRATFFCPRCQK